LSGETRMGVVPSRLSYYTSNRERKMSVLACSRPECPNIMCETYVPQIGYICWSCREEFKSHLQGRPIYGRDDALDLLQGFMNTRAGTYHHDFDIDAFLNEFTQ